jgi:hypothetical protein
MNIFVATCLSASLVCYLGSLSYHMYYMQASVSLFEQAKSRFYQTEAALVYARAWYKKNRKNLIKHKIQVPGLPSTSSMHITCFMGDQQSTCEAHLASIQAHAVVHRCVIQHDRETDKATITDWSVH